MRKPSFSATNPRCHWCGESVSKATDCLEFFHAYEDHDGQTAYGDPAKYRGKPLAALTHTTCGPGSDGYHVRLRNLTKPLTDHIRRKFWCSPLFVAALALAATIA